MSNKGFFEFLQTNFTPLFNIEELNCLEPDFKDMLKQNKCLNSVYLDTYDCNKCMEHCSLECIDLDNKFFIRCPTGYIAKAVAIPIESLERFEFNLKKFLEMIAKINFITFYKQDIDNNILMFGEKEVQNRNNKFFYSIQLFSENNLNEDIIYKIKKWVEPSEKSFIITPQAFILNEKDKSFLNENNCKVLSLDKVINKDFIILEETALSKETIKNLVIIKELVIIDKKQVYCFKKKLNISPKAFELLKLLADNTNQFVSFDKCIETLWNEQKFRRNDKGELEEIDYDSRLYNARSDINEALKNANIPASKWEKNNLILVEDKHYKLKLKFQEVFIA